MTELAEAVLAFDDTSRRDLQDQIEQCLLASACHDHHLFRQIHRISPSRRLLRILLAAARRAEAIRVTRSKLLFPSWAD